MIKTAKTSYTVVSVLRILVLLGMILFILGCGILLVMGANRLPFSFTSLSMGNVTLYLSESALPDQSIGAAEILPMLLPSGVIMAVVFYCLSVLRRILTPMKEGRPFETNVSGHIRKLGNAVLIGGAANFVAQAAASFFLKGRFELLKGLFREGVIDHITVTHTFSLNVVWIALFLYLLSYIFAYGEELQRQSDETL
jgi:hypothetical protein